MAETPEDPIAVKAFMEVSIVAHLSDLLFARQLPTGLTTAQFGVLNRLARLDLSETLSEVASAFRVAPATMSSTVDKLRRKGLVELLPCPQDGRRKRLAITPAGRRVRDEGIAAQVDLVAQFGNFVSDDEWQTLNAVLNQIRLQLEEATGTIELAPTPDKQA